MQSMEEAEEIMGKDLLLLRLRNGEGDMAEFGTIVICNLKGYFFSFSEQRRTSENPFEELKNQAYQIGEGDAVPGLELGLRHSRKGDILRVYCAAKFAYGFQGRCYQNGEPIASSSVVPIPPSTDLEYEIEILDHRVDYELDSSLLSKYEAEVTQFMTMNKTLTEEEKNIQQQTIFARYKTLQSMILRKEVGNRWFITHEYARAAKAYSKATQFAQTYFNPETEKKPSLGETMEETAKRIEAEEEKKNKPIAENDTDLVEVYLACLNNLAACKLSMKEYIAAKDLCVQVLQMDANNAKALLRAAKATLLLDVMLYVSSIYLFIELFL
jgi:tetratricopeptide (TPR) repeat protein